MTTLRLTKFELGLWEKLSTDIRNAFAGKVEEETLASFETDAQLDARLKILGESENPHLKEFVEKLSKKAEESEQAVLDPSLLEDFPPELLPDVLFTMGAGGMCIIIESILQEPDFPAENLEGLAGLTEYRHRILKANAQPITI